MSEFENYPNELYKKVDRFGMSGLLEETVDEVLALIEKSEQPRFSPEERSALECLHSILVRLKLTLQCNTTITI